MYKLIGAAAVALLGLGVSAQAADLHGRSLKDAPAAPVAYGPGHSWAGLYVGGSAGYGWGDVTNTLDVIQNEFEEEGPENFRDSSKSDIDGGIYGAHIGYNWQREHLVVGVEAGINGTDMSATSTVFEENTENGVGVKTELNWYATAVARLGYAEGSWLLYGFGGVAWGNVDTSTSVFPLGNGSSDHVGWTAGLGIEYALSERLSIRAEYSHVDLGEESASLGTTTFEEGTLTSSNKVDLSFDAVKIGASYKLTGGDRDLEPLK